MYLLSDPVIFIEQNLSWLSLAEDQLGWLLRGFPFWLELLVVWMASSRLLLSSYGAERLIWEERWYVQFCSLATITMLAGSALYTWFLLDQPLRLMIFLEQLPDWLSLFPNFDATKKHAMTTPGQVVGLGMVLYVVLLLVSKLIAWRWQPKGKKRAEYIRARRYFLPGLVGCIFGIAFPMGLFGLDEACKFRESIAGEFGEVGTQNQFIEYKNAPKPYASVQFDEANKHTEKIKKSEYRPTPSWVIEHHAVATYLVLVNLGIVGFMTVLYVPVRLLRPRWAVAGPAVIASHAMILVDQLYGFAVFNMPFALSVVVVVAIALIVKNSPRLRRFKYRFPGMETEYEKPFDLSQYCAATNDITLLSDEATLKAHLKQLPIPKGQKKPRLILVACSGGGIRAAVWAPLVLEKMTPEMRKHIRLITGASGGMVGAAAAVGVWSRLGLPQSTAIKNNGLGFVSSITAEQALLPVVQTMFVRDWFWNMILPFWCWFTSERSRELEYQWELAGKEAVGSDSCNPFTQTFADLKPHEKAGALPSLIFTPVAIEDSRRVLISNLDLKAIALPVDEQAPRRTVTALEFFKMFPSVNLKLSTAARMNATFPMISSNVSLPTTPTRRLMDAGLADNYGVELLASWLMHHRKVLEAETSGVAIVEIRAFPLQEPGTNIDENLSGVGNLIAGIAAAFLYPLLALFRARGNTNYYRNSQSISMLTKVFNDANKPDFFRSFPVELVTDASLNWYLSSVEKQGIAAQSFSAMRQLVQVRRWLRGSEPSPQPATTVPPDDGVSE